MTAIPDDETTQFEQVVSALPQSLREKVRALTERSIDARAPELDLPSLAAPLRSSEVALSTAISYAVTLEGVDSAEMQAAILERSESVVVGGERRLRLMPRARADILVHAQKSAEYLTLLNTAREKDRMEFDLIKNDEPRQHSAWLRSFLVGENGDLGHAPASELRSALSAREALEFVELPSSVPSLAETQRLMERAELIEPLRVLIGARGGWGGSPASDRFVGRGAEIRMLRGFVDELDSESTLESIGRSVRRSVRSLSKIIAKQASGILMIEARGGLGKSSLIAKFVLDHALNQRQPFPFVYLDFDHAALQPREPRQLLVEASRQVALQFPQIAGEVDLLQRDLRAAIRATSSASLPMSLDAAAQRFCLMLQEQVTRGESAFLLVLDTLEVAQYDRRSLVGVLSLIDALTDAGLAELKVVAAGRANVPEFADATRTRRAGDRHELTALTIPEARAMADRLGRDVIGPDKWQDVWASRIAGTDEDPESRREPLTVRVAVEFIRSAQDGKERDEASKQIERGGESVVITGLDGKTIAAPFVASLYLRRVVDHVRDKQARKLAWPGLLLRRITLEMIDAFLGRLCELDPGQTREVFEALGREVWIVERDGDGLRHRADLRARTLPLMYRHNPAVFDELNRATIGYFASRAHSSVDARAEWIYHRLLGGEDIVAVDRDWSDDLAPLLAGASEDLEHIVPRAAQYIVVKTAPRLLPLSHLMTLPVELVYENIARAAPSLGGFEEVWTEPTLLALSRQQPISRHKLSDIGSAAHTVISVKLGRWDDDKNDAGTPVEPWASLAAFAIKFRRTRMLGGGEASDVIDDLEYTYLRDGDSDAETPPSPGSYRLLTQDMAAARILNLSIVPQIEKRLVEAINDRGSQPLDHNALVTAIVFGGPRSSRAALQAWLDPRTRYTSEDANTVSRAQILALTRNCPGIVPMLKPLITPPLKRLGMSWSDLAAMKDPDGPLPAMRLRDEQLGAAVTNAIRAFLDRKRKTSSDLSKLDEIAELRRYFAARDADWVLPFGYAAARLFDGRRPPQSISRRLQSYGPGGLLKQISHRVDAENTDFLQIMLYADQAGDVGGMVNAILAEADLRSGAAEDFRSLAQHYSSWRDAVERFCSAGQHGTGSPDVQDPGRPPKPGPILDPDDPQKGRWGGKSRGGGRSLSAKLTEVKQKYYFVDFIVRSTDGTLLEGPVVFHLHHTYPRSVIHIRRIRDGNWAALEDVSSYGICTVGVQVKRADGRWIGLEFDLAALKGLPARFRRY